LLFGLQLGVDGGDQVAQGRHALAREREVRRLACEDVGEAVGGVRGLLRRLDEAAAGTEEVPTVFAVGGVFSARQRRLAPAAGPGGLFGFAALVDGF
jgi:hypothetical protein